ncbi:MAG: cysteine desulfurase [Gaiellaceae bacterium]|jgi:cysteine desulfurase/selenocysteine lyase
MAVKQEKTHFDAQRIRADFPIFERAVNGKPLAFLDSAVSAHKPRFVLEALEEFYEHSYGNVGRGVYALAERANEAYEQAREKVRAFVNAASPREIVFTRNTTEGLNLVAYAWGLDNLGPGDIVLATELEHHSNFVPWQEVARRTGATFKTIPVSTAGELELDDLEQFGRSGRLKIVAVTAVSNSLGTIVPVEKLIAFAHEQGAIAVIDAAQAVPHRKLDVQALGCDFLAFSGHKMCGPSGVGVLYGRSELLEKMSPFLTGGGMIRRVSVEKTTWAELPHKFEAGTPPVAEAVALGAAVDYLEGIGLEAIGEHEHELTAYALERLGELSSLTLYGPPLERRTGIVSFNLEGIHPHDVAQILDADGVCVRAGHHCNQPLMRKLGVAATSRASFYLYSLREEVDRLVAGLERARKIFA